MNRFWLGLCSLLISLMLWINFGQKEPVIQRELRVKLEARNAPVGLVAIDLPARASVIAEGPRNLLDRLDTEAVTVGVDLANGRAGVFIYPLATLTATGSRIKLEPRSATMRLTLVKTAVVTRPVVIQTQGAPPPGMDYMGAQAEPSSVAVTVPEGQGDSVKDVRALLELNRLSPTVGYIEAEVVAVDSANKPIPGATVEPRLVRILPKLTEATEAHSALVNPNWSGSPLFGYRVTGYEISPRQVRVSGSTAIKVLTTLPISLAGRRESFQVQVDLDVPDGLRLAAPTTISVVVTIEPEPGGVR